MGPSKLFVNSIWFSTEFGQYLAHLSSDDRQVLGGGLPEPRFDAARQRRHPGAHRL